MCCAIFRLKESSPVQNGVQFCGTTEQPGTPATPVNASPQQLFSRQTSEVSACDE